MSWKAVEMQVALPRTQDVGRIQEQIQQRGQFMQDTILQARLQAEQAQRQTVMNLDEGYKLTNQKDEKSKQESKSNKKSKKEKQTDHLSTIRHPYLGTKFDING